MENQLTKEEVFRTVKKWEMSMPEHEQALRDLYVAIRYSEWQNGKPFLYEINGTADVIAKAVVELVEKRRSKDTMKVG